MSLNAFTEYIRNAPDIEVSIIKVSLKYFTNAKRSQYWKILQAHMVELTRSMDAIASIEFHKRGLMYIYADIEVAQVSDEFIRLAMTMTDAELFILSRALLVSDGFLLSTTRSHQQKLDTVSKSMTLAGIYQSITRIELTKWTTEFVNPELA